VTPECQGRGYGSRLATRCCEELDGAGSAGYLETDRPANLPFYAKFGFDVVREVTVLGVPTWLMRRPGCPG
jgi:predicted N-acetyltransferase YhbS